MYQIQSEQQNPLRMVVFDFDGTLVDTMQSFADVAADVMATRHSVHFDWARARYLETSGIPFFQQLEEIFPGHNENSKAADEFEKRKLESFFSERFDADVRGALRKLQRQGYKIAVSSNNFQHLLDKFVSTEEVSFDLVLGCRENFFKGHDHFRAIQRELGVAAHEILFVGDSLMDAQRAAESGVRFVGRTGTFTSQSFKKAYPGVSTVDQLSELHAIINNSF
jgi:phosphoglycolate phosphatase-like HAD superfamily hydrolase